MHSEINDIYTTLPGGKKVVSSRRYTIRKSVPTGTGRDKMNIILKELEQELLAVSEHENYQIGKPVGGQDPEQEYYVEATREDFYDV